MPRISRGIWIARWLTFLSRLAQEQWFHLQCKEAQSSFHITSLFILWPAVFSKRVRWRTGCVNAVMVLKFAMKERNPASPEDFRTRNSTDNSSDIPARNHFLNKTTSSEQNYQNGGYKFIRTIMKTLSPGRKLPVRKNERLNPVDIWTSKPVCIRW